MVDTVCMSSTSGAADDTPTRIVAAGVALLDDEGIDAVGLRAIARRAGVSHGAPRRYFPTHRSLLAAIAREGLIDLGTAVRPALEADGDPRDRLRAAARAYVGLARSRRAMFELMFRHDILDGAGGDLRGLSLPLLQALHAVAAAENDAQQDAKPLWQNTVRLWSAIHGVAVLVANRALDPVAELIVIDVDDLLDSIVDTALPER